MYASVNARSVKRNFALSLCNLLSGSSVTHIASLLQPEDPEPEFEHPYESEVFHQTEHGKVWYFNCNFIIIAFSRFR